MGKKIKTGLLTLLILGASAAVTAENLPDINELRDLYTSNQRAQVYELMKPLEAEFAGQAAYDRLFAQAALSQSRPDEATWALERLVLVEPRSLSAKYLLAEAYFQLERYSSAQRQLDIIKERQPTESMSNRVARLEQRIQQRTQPTHLKLTTRVELALGYDSNVTSSPGTPLDAVPEGYEEDDSVFSILTLRQRLTYTPIDSISLFAGYRFRDTRPYSESEFIRQNLALNFGAAYRADRWRVSLEPTYAKGWKDGEGEFDEKRLAVNGRYTLDNNSQVLGFLSRSQIEYDQTPANDGDFNLIGGGWAGHPLGAQLPLLLVATGNYLFTDQPDSPVGEFSGFGTSVNASYRLNAQQNYFVRFSSSFRSYDCDGHPVTSCDSQREDLQLRYSLGAQFRFASSWRVEPRLTYIDQQSNSDPYEYQRLITQVSLRYDFDTWTR
ncbi:tetratricopeptide repeat protein [Marinospirillum celere]|uniref:tetratricopeptide repeat protein n=1 Tax=Marinospirillum celere TaxID=1122252 RepID=UPI0015A722B6|nr:tetratricopeptide repeat protein [Marinospirillum celere]